MKIIRHISSYWDFEQILVLKKYGIDVQKGNQSFTMDEDDRYYSLEKKFIEWDVINTRGFIFSSQEILSSKTCMIHGWHECGYPMPDGNNGYLELTYDGTYCPHCLSGLIQKNTFRIKKVPKKELWGLNWVFDELFVSRTLYENLFAPLSIGCREVRSYALNEVIDSVVQLEIPIMEEQLNMMSCDYTICTKCGNKKFSAKDNGFFPSYATDLHYHICKTRELFGDGGICFRRIMVSSYLRDELIKRKILKLHNFTPCKPL